MPVCPFNLAGLTDASTDRTTQYLYDWRDRMIGVKAGVQATESSSLNRPIVIQDLDNLGETTATYAFDGDNVALSDFAGGARDAGGQIVHADLLRGYQTTAYDDQGRAYQQKSYSVDPTTGVISSTALTSQVFYDHRGNVIEAVSPSGLVTKNVFDGVGRLVKSYQTDGGAVAAGSINLTWAAASSITADWVIDQTEYIYDKNSNLIETISKDRFDNATGSGELGDASGIWRNSAGTSTGTGKPASRVSYHFAYYDAANRLTATVNAGTNGGTFLARPTSAAGRSDTMLVDSYAYNPAGWVDSHTDPRALVEKFTYDALGRTTQTVQAYASGAVTAVNNQTTKYAYNALNQVTTMTAVMPTGTVNQVTAYTYGVTTAGGSGINSTGLLSQTSYPDKTTGAASTLAADQESYKYNLQGEVISLTDRNGTVHTFTLDVLGRVTTETITTLGAGVDGSVRRIETAYDGQGNAYLITSYDAVTGGNIVSQVQRTYNGLGQLTAEYQSHGGAVDTTTTPAVQYTYADPSLGGRLTGLIYPNGRSLTYGYAAGIDGKIGRLSYIADTATGVHLEDYSYLGLATIVQRAHAETGVNLTYIKQGTATNGEAGDQYVGLDRFGRVVDQNWTKGGVSTDRFQYGYDRDGNVLFKNNLVNPNLSELYHANAAASGDNATAYDALNRLKAFQRGTLSSSGLNGTGLDTVAASSASESWVLDAVGNITSQTTNGTAQASTVNSQNELTNVGTSTVAYDNAGNLTQDGSGKTFVYDAWNHLIAVKNASGVEIARYRYDAMGRRVQETYLQSDGVTKKTTELYYSASWQVLEERQGGTATANVTQQYVWSIAYIDAMILRDSYTNGVRTQRLYVQQDANFNVTALVNTAGQVVERYVEDPYGNVTVLNPDGTVRGASAFGWQYLHQGGRLDGVTGWFLFRHRDYSPVLARWTEADPLGYPDGANRYQYVGDNPAVYHDPFGQMLTMPCPLPWTGWLPGLIDIGELAAAFGQAAVEALLTDTGVGILGLLLADEARVWSNAQVAEIEQLARQAAEMQKIDAATQKAIHDILAQKKAAALAAAAASAAAAAAANQLSDKAAKDNDAAKKPTLVDLKKAPPTHPDYVPPKGWNGQKVKNPNGSGAGYPARNGDVWVPAQHPAHAPHWDVQHPDGTHTPVYPQ